MTKLEALAKDCIENHTHRLVDKPTKQDIYLREESIFIQGYRQSEKRIAELEEVCHAIQELLDNQIETTNKLFKEKAELKKLLNEFMRISKAGDEDFEHEYSELIAEAEQFLKEVENDR